MEDPSREINVIERVYERKCMNKRLHYSTPELDERATVTDCMGAEGKHKQRSKRAKVTLDNNNSLE